MNPVVRVAVGVLRNEFGEILIALRPSHKHQGNLWEFPGGKIEEGEECEQALDRELYEELGIRVLESRPLIQVPFLYKDKSVFLDVREVARFAGVPVGNEGQQIRWVNPSELNSFHFPAANVPILKAVQLPDFFAVTGVFSNAADMAAGIERAIQRGAEMIQFRPASIEQEEIKDLIGLAARVCSKKGKSLVVNSSVGIQFWDAVSGLHLNSHDLRLLTERPVGLDKYFGASCHNQEELELAAKLGVDYVFLSPVLPTESHRFEPCLGWDGFANLVSDVRIPVYALGGMSVSHFDAARKAGARGIAAIRWFWDEQDSKK